MTRQEILDELKTVFHVVIDSDADLAQISESTTLDGDLGLSSIGLLYLILSIEQKFSISFENVDFADFKNVGDTITYIDGKLEKKNQ
jgi:acyl carrier protein